MSDAKEKEIKQVISALKLQKSIKILIDKKITDDEFGIIPTIRKMLIGLVQESEK